LGFSIEEISQKQKMKIALVTSGFDYSKPGGVSNVVLRMVTALERKYDVEILTFANKATDPGSIQLFKPSSYGKLKTKTINYQGTSIRYFGVIGSEFEFLRYRKRKELRDLFEKFDLVIVVTGILQFANVIPRLNIPVYVQCATRLQWERKSQYRGMKYRKKLFLKIQLPILKYQEFLVTQSNHHFLPENERMQRWLLKRTKQEVSIWYPGTKVASIKSNQTKKVFLESKLISVGRFGDRRKGWERLILAYKISYDNYGPLPELNIVGWGVFDLKASKLLEKIGQKYPIKIHSNLTNLERDQLLADSSFYLQTSFEEGLGLAAIEALSFGLPILSSETDGSAEYVIEGKTGKKIPQGPGFVTNFAEGISELRNWNQDYMKKNAQELFLSKFEEKVSSSILLKLISKSAN
jgi:glycosyltransferase involved in cell wall biosynthesis